MKLRELIEDLDEVTYQVAVIEECIVYLQKCLDGDVEIPVDAGDGSVPEEIILDMMTSMREEQKSRLARFSILDELEVPHV